MLSSVRLFFKPVSFFFLTFFIFLTYNAIPQNPSSKKYELKGYIKDLQNTWIEDFDKEWLGWNNINNRFDFKWYPDSLFTLGVGIRNQFNYGQLIQLFNSIYPQYISQYENDPGYIDLSTILSKSSSYVLTSTFDRAYIQYSKNKWDIRAGRQRVNWGIGLVWNPNDIFNTFSYFDFDYEERPGCDALRLQYYPSYTSNFQVVSKLNAKKELTMAGLYKFNKWNYDIQFLGGVMENDVVIGSGWAGQIHGGGFRGEISWFSDKNHFLDTNGILVATIEGDYTFKNSLYSHIAFLYTSNGTTGKAGWGTFFLTQDISAKSFTRARYSLFGQLTYPLTPLVNLGLSGILNPTDKSVFYSPSVEFSLTENIGLLLMGQIFSGKKDTEFGNYGGIYYVRLKYSF